MYSPTAAIEYGIEKGKKKFQAQWGRERDKEVEDGRQSHREKRKKRNLSAYST